LVEDSATVDSQSIYSFVSSYGTWTDTDPDTGETYSRYNVGARVKVTFGDSSSKILPIVYPDFPGETFDFAEFFEEGGNNESGFGTGNWATPSPIEFEMWSEAMFSIQLGEITEEGAWGRVLALSDPVTGSYLKDNGSVFIDPPWNVPNAQQWSPTIFHTIPEPSSGLLLLFGLAPLLLARKRSI